MVRQFFVKPNDGESHVDRFQKFLASNADDLVHSLEGIIPQQCELLPQNAINASANDLAGSSGVEDRLRRRLKSYEDQCTQLKQQLLEASNAGEHDRLGPLGRAIKSTDALREQVLEPYRSECRSEREKCNNTFVESSNF